MAIDYQKRDGVAYITLNNPTKANILDKKTSDEISECWIDLWEDREIRCAILTGAARDFCRTWPDQSEITDPGIHYIQEDAGPQIGRAILLIHRQPGRAGVHQGAGHPVRGRASRGSRRPGSGVRRRDAHGGRA